MIAQALAASPAVAALLAAIAVGGVGGRWAARPGGSRRPSPTSGGSPAPERTPRGTRRRRRHAGLAALLTIALVAGPLLAAIVGAGALAVPSVRSVADRRRRRAAIARGLPDVADLLVVSIRAGLTPRQAVTALGTLLGPPFAEAFVEVVRRTERGESFPDALRALPDVLGLEAADIADTIGTGERYGLAIEPMLDELATQARAARRRVDQADARTLPVRLAFPLVTCTLPAYVLVAVVPAVLAALHALGDTRP